MITVYKRKTIPTEAKPIVINNDVFFNKNTVELLDEQSKKIIMEIDHSEMISKYTIKSRFHNMMLNIDRLSTGCKTVLNVLYNPDRIFDVRECGDNALDAIYALPQGNIYCDYPLISFQMTEVQVCDKTGIFTIGSYEALKEWWKK